MSGEATPNVLGNEFATVEIETDTRDGRQRLPVRSVVTEAETYFDPLDLELLATLAHRFIRKMLACPIEPPDEYLEADRHDR